MMKILTYAELRQSQKTHYLRQHEIPVEHSLSWPVPTLRWGIPAYACFASPAHRMPGKPLVQGPPDRWWLIDARNGHLLLYALTRLHPFSQEAWSDVEFPAVQRSLAEQKELLAGLEQHMATAADRFLSGEQLSSSEQADLKAVFSALVPDSLAAQYHALVPDFFEWLG